jgi:hypothetical protein
VGFLSALLFRMLDESPELFVPNVLESTRNPTSAIHTEAVRYRASPALRTASNPHANTMGHQAKPAALEYNGISSQRPTRCVLMANPSQSPTHEQCQRTPELVDKGSPVPAADPDRCNQLPVPLSLYPRSSKPGWTRPRQPMFPQKGQE